MGEVPAVSDDLLGLEVSMPNPDSSHLVFVLGCARSGTSILGETLAAHPGVHFCFEDNLIWDRAFPDRVDDRLEREAAGSSRQVKIVPWINATCVMEASTWDTVRLSVEP